MTELIAVDMLIEPDEATRVYARALNRRLRQAMPEGFALDDTHVPHITLLQRYVRTADLDAALEAVGSTVAAQGLTPVGLRATGSRTASGMLPESACSACYSPRTRG